VLFTPGGGPSDGFDRRAARSLTRGPGLPWEQSGVEKRPSPTLNAGLNEHPNGKRGLSSDLAPRMGVSISC
jgi:hypothetical protein